MMLMRPWTIAGGLAAFIGISAFLLTQKPEPKVEPVAAPAVVEPAEPEVKSQDLPMKYGPTECANGRAYRGLTRAEVIEAAQECKRADMGVDYLVGGNGSDFANIIVCVQCIPTKRWQEPEEPSDE